MSKEEDRAKEVATAQILVARGARAERFLREDFWLMDLEPALAKIQSQAGDQKGWRPGAAKTIDEVALSAAYFSAVDETIGEVLRKINQMIAAGQEAEAYLKKVAEGAK